jgi:hypothetical protein
MLPNGSVPFESAGGYCHLRHKPPPSGDARNKSKVIKMTDAANPVAPPLRVISGEDIRHAAIKGVKKMQTAVKGDPVQTIAAAIQKLVDHGLVSNSKRNSSRLSSVAEEKS